MRVLDHDQRGGRRRGRGARRAVPAGRLGVRRGAVHRLTGIGVSPGIAAGRAVLLMQNPLVIRFPIGPERVAGELARLEEARERSRRQLREIKDRVAAAAGSELSSLFDAQLLMLDDAMLVAGARDLIRRERVNAEWAVQQAFEGLAGIFDKIEDPYLRERKGDVADVAGRLRMNLSGGRGRGPDLFRDVDEASVLVADDLTPSMAAQVDWQKIRGFASDTGSHTHHTAILARSLRVPAVVGLGEACRRVIPGATVLIDGSTGELILDPPAEYLDRARGLVVAVAAGHGRASVDTKPPLTRDGVCVALRANIELPGDVAVVRACGAEGVGLYRSEFLLATTPADALTEDVQYEAYRALLEGVAPGPLTVRTFDVGEEQLLPWPGGGQRLGAAGAARPGGPLGLRAIRLSLARREVFKTQLRALLRAARHGRLRVIFPFVSGLEELREARAVLREAMAELEARGEAVGPPPPVGVMIEIPSAAVTADLLAREADFFSIGTNDLVQYPLAVDRTDAGVSRLFEPLHPAVLRILRGTIRAAARHGLPVSLCGEMAADPALLPLLVGLGLRDFSMSPSAIPTARSVILGLDSRGAARLASRVLRLGTVAEIERCLARRPR
ncbi:MAG: phosphoenolpyruvate--protein phosphotransferase [Acidobacteria bacterium]|nr:MAG: phosphoenolpyruvate--protein phosphotransferase [Acidobacteriota bacterium]